MMSKTQAQVRNVGHVEGTTTEMWGRLCARWRGELGEAVYSSWFTRLELDRIDHGCAVLSVPTKFLKSWIQAHYFEKLRAALLAEMPEVREVILDLRAAGRITTPRAER